MVDEDETNVSVSISAAYARSVTSVASVMTQAEEVRLAKRLEKLEIELAKELLSYTPRLKSFKDRIARIKGLRKHLPIKNQVTAIRAKDKICVYDLYKYLDSVRSSTVGFRRFVARCRAIYTRIEAVRNRFMKSNLRLVVKIARSRRSKMVPFLDLVQEGNIGLMEAVKRFDYRKGFKFSTYAAWWIWSYVVRACDDQARTVRIPAQAHDDIGKILGVEQQMFKLLGRDPTRTELAKRIGMKEGKLNDMLMASKTNISLDWHVSDENETLLIDRLVDSAETPVETFIRCESERIVRETLVEMEERDARILCRRFGLGQSGEATLERVGRDMKLSRERVRQLESRALKRFKEKLVERYGQNIEERLES